MKTWRIITAAATAFALAATIGCNADNSKDQNNNAPEPAVQDEGQAGAGGTNAPADNPSTEDEGISGDGQGTEPSTGANGGAGDQPVDLPTPVDPAEPQSDDPAAGESGDGGEGVMTILPIIEPAPNTENTPGAVRALPEPTDPGLTAPDGNASNPGGGVDPNTPVSKQAAVNGSDSAAGTVPGAPADYGDGREPAPVLKAMPATGQ